MTSNNLEYKGDASYTLRLLASTFNWVFFFIVILVCDVSFLSDISVYVFFIIPIAQLVLYLNKGATLGKLIFGIVVIDKEGEKPNHIKLMAHMFLGSILSLISIPIFIITGKKEQIYDKYLGLRVVYTGIYNKSNITRRKRALLVDITSPIAVVVAFIALYIAIFLIYLFLGAVTVGMLWFLLEEELEIASYFIFYSALASIAILFIVQIVLCFYKKSSIGKLLYKIKIVDSETGDPATNKQLMIRGLMNNWITSVTVIYPVICYYSYKKTGQYPHDRVAGTTVTEI